MLDTHSGWINVLVTAEALLDDPAADDSDDHAMLAEGERRAIWLWSSHFMHGRDRRYVRGHHDHDAWGLDSAFAKP
jgi:hypothetical protein